MAARSHHPYAHGHSHSGPSQRADSAIVDDHAFMDAANSSSPGRPVSPSSPLSSTTSSSRHPHKHSSGITVTVRPPSPSLAERILIPDSSPSSSTSPTAAASSTTAVNPTDADMLADLLHSKFSHMSLERQDAPSLMDVFGSGLDRVSIRHLLPTHASLVKSALDSANLEYCTAIVTRIRKFLSMDRVPDAVDNVLALHILPRLTALLGFDDVPPALKYEVCWVLTNVAAGSSAQTRELAGTPGLVVALVRLVAAPEMNRDVRVQALWCLGNIVGDGDHLKAVVVREGGVEAAAKFARERVVHLREQHAGAGASLAQEEEDNSSDDDEEDEGEEELNPTARIVAWFASNVSRGIRSAEDWPAIQPLVPILHALLTWPDLDTIVDASWGLARVLQPIDRLHDLALTPSQTSPATLPMVTQLVRQLCLADGYESCSQSTAIRLRSPALRALTNLSTATDAWHIQLLIDAGAVPALYELARSGVAASVQGVANLPRWDGASPRAFSRDKIPGYMAKDALLVLANMVACTDVESVVVRGVLEAAPVVQLWYTLLVAGLVPAAAAAQAGPAFATRSGRMAPGAAALAGVDVTLVREVAWALSNMTTSRAPLVMDCLTRHVDVGEDWRQVLIAGIGAGTAAPTEVLGLGVQMRLLVPRAGGGTVGGVVPPPPSVRRSAKSVAGTKKLSLAPGSNGSGSSSGEEYEAIMAEIREKCADALLNMAIVLAPAGWLTHEHVANIDKIMAYVAKTEGGTRERYAEVRELVMVPGNGVRRRVFDDQDDGLEDVARGSLEATAMRGLEDVLGALSQFSMDEEQRAMAAVASGKGKLGPFGLLPSKGEGLAHLVAEKGVHHVLVPPPAATTAVAAGMVAPAEEEYVSALRRLSLTSMTDQAV